MLRFKVGLSIFISLLFEVVSLAISALCYDRKETQNRYIRCTIPTIVLLSDLSFCFKILIILYLIKKWLYKFYQYVIAYIHTILMKYLAYFKCFNAFLHVLFNKLFGTMFLIVIFYWFNYYYLNNYLLNFGIASLSQYLNINLNFVNLSPLILN